jgi:hypothetical protein
MMRTVTDFSELGAIDGGSDMSVFNPVQADSCVVENAPLDVTSNLNGKVTPGAVRPVISTPKTSLGKFIPQKNATLNKRIDALENAMVQVVDGFAEINGKLDKLSGN